MKNTSELVGVELDAAVAQAMGWVLDHNWWRTPGVNGTNSHVANWLPSTSWIIGGPIIEQGFISIDARPIGGATPTTWRADIGRNGQDFIEYGPTPLIAAMRAFVASRLAGREGM